MPRGMLGKNNPNYGKGLFGKDNGMYDVHRYGKDSPTYGKHWKLSEETVLQKSESMKGKNNPMYGKHHSEKTREKQRKTRLGKEPWNKGKHASLETIEKLKLTHLGQKAWNKGLTSEIDDRILVGKDNGNWSDGISFLPYCSKFNKRLKESIRERDNHTCQLCNKTQMVESKKLSVHHIHYDKENCNPDLISLCCGCNSKVNVNRTYYEELFMNKLNERELLFWKRSDL